jgi:hypothetical protein
MTLLTLVLAAAAGSSAPIAIIADSKRPGTEAAADELVSAVYLALVEAGVPRDALLFEEQAEGRTRSGSFARARQCEGRTLCLHNLAQQLGSTGVVVGVDVGRVSNELAAHVVAVSSAGPPLAELEVSADVAMWSGAVKQALPAFARTLLGKRDEAAGPVVVPAVADRVLAPEPVAAEVTARPVAPAWKWTAGGGAAASFVIAAVMLGVGASDKAAYDRTLLKVDGLSGTTLTAAQAQQLGGRVNTELSVALGFALAGAALAAVAAWLFVRG